MAVGALLPLLHTRLHQRTCITANTIINTSTRSTDICTHTHRATRNSRRARTHTHTHLLVVVHEHEALLAPEEGAVGGCPVVIRHLAGHASGAHLQQQQQGCAVQCSAVVTALMCMPGRGSGGVVLPELGAGLVSWWASYGAAVAALGGTGCTWRGAWLQIGCAPTSQSRMMRCCGGVRRTGKSLRRGGSQAASNRRTSCRQHRQQYGRQHGSRRAHESQTPHALLRKS